MKVASRCLLLIGLLFVAAVTVRSVAAQTTSSQQTTDSTRAGSEHETTNTAAYSLPPEKLAKAIALGRIRNILHFVDALWGLAVLWLLLHCRWAVRLEAWTKQRACPRWIQGLLFFMCLLLITAIAGLPLDVYSHHISLAYGISVQGWGGWLLDLLKALALSLVIIAPLFLLFNWIVRCAPRRYWLIGWMVTLPLMVLGVFVSPLTDPIFNHFEPLIKSNAPLVDQLERVVARTGTQIAPDRMFLMKASEKTNGLNAYVTGIGATKRFVMWDTATKRLPDNEILFIFGHESGHYILNHIPKSMGMIAIGLLVVYWLCFRAADWVVRHFGAHWGVDSIGSRTGFVVLLLLFSLTQFLGEPISNTLSRHFEHEADVYGQEAIHGIVADPQTTAVSAFNHLGEAWLEDPHPSAFIEFWEYNHPSVQTRANFAAQYDPWANGGHGRFFAK